MKKFDEGKSQIFFFYLTLSMTLITFKKLEKNIYYGFILISLIFNSVFSWESHITARLDIWFLLTKDKCKCLRTSVLTTATNPASRGSQASPSTGPNLGIIGRAVSRRVSSIKSLQNQTWRSIHCSPCGNMERPRYLYPIATLLIFYC